MDVLRQKHAQAGHRYRCEIAARDAHNRCTVVCTGTYVTALRASTSTCELVRDENGRRCVLFEKKVLVLTSLSLRTRFCNRQHHECDDTGGARRCSARARTSVLCSTGDILEKCVPSALSGVLTRNDRLCGRVRGVLFGVSSPRTRFWAVPVLISVPSFARYVFIERTLD